MAVLSHSCCHNKSFFNKIATEASVQIDKIQTDSYEVIGLITIVSNYNFTNPSSSIVLDDSAVPISKDRQVLFQSFLI